MKSFTLKKKLMMFVFMVSFMLIYMILFGTKNGAVGIMIVMAALMNLGNDLSFKPKRSFIRILGLLLVLGIVSFLNNPLSVFGCILTFIVVFGTTFTSYHLFGASVYLPYLMCYFMMVSIPVSLEEMPLRLIGLALGAIFIVGLNLLINRRKDYKLSTSTINGLIAEIGMAVDVKLNGGEVSKESFKSVNGFYSSLYSKFEYKFFPSPAHESVINVVKAFQYIGVLLSNYTFADDELIYIREVLDNLSQTKSKDIFNGIEVKTKEMNLVLLNLEIIVSEIENRDLTQETVLPDKETLRRLIKPILKQSFSFKSPEFTFAFKMAVILTLWQVLTLIFNLPFTKWLYFASIPLMLPYVDDVSDTARSRLFGTLIGAGVFSLLIVAMSYVSISPNTLFMLVFVICIFGMVFTMENRLKMTIFTTVMSVMTALIYITPPQAIVLKVLWVVVAVVVVSIFNFAFLPYSVEKETKNNLKISFKLNERLISLIKRKCEGGEVSSKTTNVVVFNIVREKIEVTDENRNLFEIQGKITDIGNFIINYMDIYEFSHDTKEKIIRIIDDNEQFDRADEIQDNVILFSTRHIITLFEDESKLLNELNTKI